MYKWKINMIDGKSYVVESDIGKADDFINDSKVYNLGD